MNAETKNPARQSETISERRQQVVEPDRRDGTSDDIETEDGFLAAVAKHTEGVALLPPVGSCENTSRSRYLSR